MEVDEARRQESQRHEHYPGERRQEQELARLPAGGGTLNIDSFFDTGDQYTGRAQTGLGGPAVFAAEGERAVDYAGTGLAAERSTQAYGQYGSNQITSGPSGYGGAPGEGAFASGTYGHAVGAAG